MITKHKLITGPSTEPITLAEVKSNLSIPTDDTSKDTEIEDIYIPAARQQIEEFLGSALITQTWKVVFDTFPSEIELLKTPVQSITSIQYYDTDNALQTYSSSNYYLDNYGDKNWILPAADTDWPSTYKGNYRANAVEVTYVAGYSTASDVPVQIKQALHLMVGHYVNYQRQAESGISDTRSANWIMRDLLGRMKKVRF